MGVEVMALLTIGSSLLQARATNQAAEADAEAVVRQGELQGREKAKEVRLRAARQQSSFLTSGLTLEGTPMAAIQSTFATGLEDINQISENTNIRSKNIISTGRTEALSGLAGSVAGSFGSGDIFSGSNTFGSQGSVSRTLEFGSPNVQGPIQGFGGFGG